MRDKIGGAYNEELPNGMTSFMDRIFHTRVVLKIVIKAFPCELLDMIGGTYNEKLPKGMTSFMDRILQ